MRASQDRIAEARVWKSQTALTALLLLVVAAGLWCIPINSHVFFPLYQVQSQDLLPLVVLGASILAVAFWTPRWHLPDCLPSGRSLLVAGLAIAALLAFGTHALLSDFPLSIDERMVVFDMAVFERLQLATPFAEQWRPYTKAVHPAFLLNDDMPTGLVSSYLPMNAFLRMAFAQLADPAFFNPLLALAGGVALLDIARRTFKDDAPACCVVLLIYALSAQMLVNAMTVYSMTGHMALNLIWLAAFLRGGRWGHTIAILTGFVATGLHQLVFHPFFVAPFVLWRLRHRDWNVVLLYGAAYSAIILWWIAYPLVAGAQVASELQQATNSSFPERIAGIFTIYRPDAFVTTFLNLVRFFAWQHVALVPLLLAAIAVAVRRGGLPAVLLSGIALWVVFIAAVIPFQGHGWGYRYLHGYLGSFALLAGYGYQELKGLLDRRADGLVLALTGVTLLATIPLLFNAAHRFAAPYIAVERLVAAQRTPVVLIDDEARPGDGRTGNAIETVRNRPDLTNRPLRLSSRGLTPELLANLCRHGPIALVSLEDQYRVGFARSGFKDPTFAELVEPVRAKMPQCFVAAEVPASPLRKGARWMRR